MYINLKLNGFKAGTPVDGVIMTIPIILVSVQYLMTKHKVLPFMIIIKGNYYLPQEWVEAVQKFMISVLAVLLIGPFVFVVWQWGSVGGTV